MIEYISIPDKDSYIGKILFFVSADLTQFDRVIPLFGPNGAGKSTLLKSILDSSTARGGHGLNVKCSGKTSVYSYFNGSDNFKGAPRSYESCFDPMFIKAHWDSQKMSEGQSIIYSMFPLLSADFSDLVSDFTILLDEVDSGLSIDNIDTMMRKIKSLIRKYPKVQIIFSFNSPRILKWFPKVLSMYDGDLIEMHSDEDMLSEIRKHKKEFDKARKKSNGMPKSFD